MRSNNSPFMHKFFHEHPDVISVLLAHTGAIALTFTNVEWVLKILSLLLAIGYTGWKWVYEWKKSKK
jgi:hypothetical protein